MRVAAKTARRLRSPFRAALPYLGTAALVIEADRIIDIQALAWPALGAVAAAIALDRFWTRRHG